MTLMDRRRALMARKNGGDSITLVNGTYADGKVVVTNGNTLQFDSPTQYAITAVPLTKSLSVASTVETKVNQQLGTFRIYAVIDGTNSQIGDNSHNAETWETINESGTITALAFMARSATYEKTFSISLKIDGEVIF